MYVNEEELTNQTSLFLRTLMGLGVTCMRMYSPMAAVPGLLLQLEAA